MNNRRPNTDPWGTPHVRHTIDDLRSPRRTYCVRPSRYDWNHRWTVSLMLKVTRRPWSRISWSTVSNAADKSRRTSAAELPRSAGCQTILAWQQFQSKDLVENQTVVAVEDKRTLHNPSAGEQRGVRVASTAPVDTNKQLWCPAPAFFTIGWETPPWTRQENGRQPAIGWRAQRRTAQSHWWSAWRLTPVSNRLLKICPQIVKQRWWCHLWSVV